jgi:hypothetical protein
VTTLPGFKPNFYSQSLSQALLSAAFVGKEGVIVKVHDASRCSAQQLWYWQGRFEPFAFENIKGNPPPLYTWTVEACKSRGCSKASQHPLNWSWASRTFSGPRPGLVRMHLCSSARLCLVTNEPRSNTAEVSRPAGAALSQVVLQDTCPPEKAQGPGCLHLCITEAGKGHDVTSSHNLTRMREQKWL